MARRPSTHCIATIALLMFAGACGGKSATESGTSADTAADQPPNFADVTTGIYRGGHPDAGGLLYLQQNFGVTTIIDLEIGDFIEATPSSIDAEISGATALGINDIREPISAFSLGLSSSFDQKITAALGILADPSQKPVYVHCAHGQDRTGLVIGLERVFNEGWAPAAAWQEMLAHGFHVGFLGLDDYFFRKTGWNPVSGGGSNAGADAGATSASNDASAGASADATAGCTGVPNGAYCGGDGVTGDPNTLFQCTGGSPSVVEVCSSGCSYNGGGADACE
jgi:tyrosine-protein phosphatase SIW14